ncbi:MAG: NADP-dependent isocitrate dehydrogenase [Candidatus Sericytochromatia bacterium]
MENKQVISVAHGDGIGPEIMDATLMVLKAAHARLDIQEVVIGQQAYEAGYKSGVTPKAWDAIRRTKVLLKSPVITPPDSRYKSPNVIIRKMLGMYANVRPCVSYHPFVPTRHPRMNVVIIRENEEDLYAGIEHRQTGEVTQCTKLITRPGCHRIVRYAFEYARSHYRKKVTCFTKDNIMKMTDGLFHKIFNAVAQEYPDIENEHWIVDIGTAKVADTPEQFDVLVAPNLYGDILNDMTAQLAGSIGMAGSANFGGECAMFETVHGAVPHRAGQDQANPSGMLMAGVMMLNHIGQPEVAEWVHNAWLKTLEDGIHTYDVHLSGDSFGQLVGTNRFAQEVIDRLGQEPQKLSPVRYHRDQPIFQIPPYKRPVVKKDLVGVDAFLFWEGSHVSGLVQQLEGLDQSRLKLKLITNRGVKVWPEGFPETFCTDHWRLRLLGESRASNISHADVIAVLAQLQALGLEFIKTELLFEFDGEKGFS